MDQELEQIVNNAINDGVGEDDIASIIETYDKEKEIKLSQDSLEEMQSRYTWDFETGEPPVMPKSKDYEEITIRDETGDTPEPEVPVLEEESILNDDDLAEEDDFIRVNKIEEYEPVSTLPDLTINLNKDIDDPNKKSTKLDLEKDK